MRSRSARTGAPASASTALMPTVRSSVLLPDMFEPLTSSTCSAPPEVHRVADAARRGQQRMPQLVAFEAGARLDDLGKRIVGVLVGVAGQRAQGLELAERCSHPPR